LILALCADDFTTQETFGFSGKLSGVNNRPGYAGRKKQYCTNTFVV
jgi:hypothetical protein